ncbi:MAG TPA: NF041680 family putative transposase [Streptosporangiaceae bacterium]|nr:NF041680 family putative transposase [Streptosporangiaceae bacterium]
MGSVPQDPPGGHGDAGARRGDLARFREVFYGCLTARADAQFELTDAVLCADGPVRSLADLSLAPEHRRGHGALYDGLNHGAIEIARLRRGLAGLPLPRVGDRIVLAADVSPWLRPDAETSPQRLFCHVHGRAKGTAQMIPGWPYSVVAALGSGRTSWTAVLDAVRLGPADDATVVTAAQLREVVDRLRQAGHWRAGDPTIWIVLDSGYDLARLAFLLADLPVVLIGRLRSDRVLARPVEPRRPDARGRPRRHGPVLVLADPITWPAPEHTSSTDTTRYGTAQATAWHRCHPRLEHRGPWRDHPGELPIIEGTLIRLQVAHLPGDRAPKPLWLWTSDPAVTGSEIDRAWQAFLRRFDLEHTFRFVKQTLGWTTPKLRDPAAADRWTWLVIAAHTQLRLARDLVTDLRRPWERPCPPGRLTPARVRRGFRRLRPKITLPARAPKPHRPGPGRPPGIPNRHRAPRHDVGKTATRAHAKTVQPPIKG